MQNVKKLAPLLLVLLAASLWSWTQRARPPKMVPTRANCTVHGIHLGERPDQVISACGPPDRHKEELDRKKQRLAVWVWDKRVDQDELLVRFVDGAVAEVRGTSLSVGSKDFELDAGSMIDTAGFLGTPTSTNSYPEIAEPPTEWIRTWLFPEICIEVIYGEKNRINGTWIRTPLKL